MADELTLFCGEQETGEAALLARFGTPEAAAAEYLEGLDGGVMSRYAYRRMWAAYGLLAAVVVLALSGIGLKLWDYRRTESLLANSQTGEFCYHHDRKDVLVYGDREKAANHCTVFYVKTNWKGQDYFWEYHSCTNRFYYGPAPRDWDGTEPYAKDVYVNINGEVTHWHSGEEHRGWVKVYDIE